MISPKNDAIIIDNLTNFLAKNLDYSVTYQNHCYVTEISIIKIFVDSFDDKLLQWLCKNTNNEFLYGHAWLIKQKGWKYYERNDEVIALLVYE